MIWLGERRGYLNDWVTQQWVRATGRRIKLEQNHWLNGPTGNATVIGRKVFERYAAEHALQAVDNGIRGLIPDFRALDLPADVPVAPAVRDFYERTSEYEIDAWSEWHGLFRPFGRALAFFFSRRLQQLNVPLSPLDSSKGMSSSVTQFRDPLSGRNVLTAWVRELHATGNVLYAGGYSICRIPDCQTPCVKVVFPLPNGNAIVLMKTEVHPDGSFSVTSAGDRFGEPGFYFTLHGPDGIAWARYVRAMQETIHVFPAEGTTVRADHTLWFAGIQFLRLHYRMRRRQT